jgi:hypothetical protein
MRTEHLNSRDAAVEGDEGSHGTRRRHVLVLCAVFVPVAFWAALRA